MAVTWPGIPGSLYLPEVKKSQQRGQKDSLITGLRVYRCLTSLAIRTQRSTRRERYLHIMIHPHHTVDNSIETEERVAEV